MNSTGTRTSMTLGIIPNLHPLDRRAHEDRNLLVHSASTILWHTVWLIIPSALHQAGLIQHGSSMWLLRQLFKDMILLIIISREHLYRCHMPIFCPRCKAMFRTKPALDKHLMIAVADVCEVRDCPPPAGITIEQEKELKSRKKSSPGQSEEDKWNNIYSLLFPTEATPSCCKSSIRPTP